MSYENQFDGRPLSEGTKNDRGKLPWHLLPFDALEEVVKVLQHGAAQYGDRNWERGMRWSRVYAAALRHVTAYVWKGRRDPDTGLSHLAHLVCCALFLLAYECRGVGEDDLPGGPK